MIRFAALLPVLVFVVLSMPSAHLAAAEGHPLSGVIKYEGEPFQRQALRMNADPKCEEMHSGERVLNDARLVSQDGGVQNVMVYLKELPNGAGPFTAPEESVELRQEGCMYIPKVLGIVVSQKLDVYNDDPTLHNVRFLARANRPFNLGQPAKGKRTKFFTKVEKAVKFKCDVHPWMSSTLFVFDHPFFATTDENGHFTISGLPPGRHTLVAWHEAFGELEVEIDVPTSDEISLIYR